MSKFMKVAAASVAAAAALTSLAACSSGSNTAADDKGSVYYLSFKPEQDAIWQEVAKAYTAETGVEVKVVTAASGTYEQTLKSEIAKSDAPTLFQINGPIGLKNWKDYTADLTNTDFAKALLDPSMAVSEDGKVYGVPYVVEGYGIIYNQKIMDAYFALDGAKAKSMDEITDFETLKAVADDMQAKKDQLGIDGVFASTSLKPGEDWRWQTHLADLPVYFEYQDNKVDDMADLTFSHNEEFKNIFDLYLTDSTIDPKLASSKAVTDSMAEFALGKAAMVQNGNWAYGQIAEVAGNTVAAEDVKMLPIYTGREGEDKQGLNIGTETFFSPKPTRRPPSTSSTGSSPPRRARSSWSRTSASSRRSTPSPRPSSRPIRSPRRSSATCPTPRRKRFRGSSRPSRARPSRTTSAQPSPSTPPARWTGTRSSSSSRPNGRPRRAPDRPLESDLIP